MNTVKYYSQVNKVLSKFKISIQNDHLQNLFSLYFDDGYAGLVLWNISEIMVIQICKK